MEWPLSGLRVADLSAGIAGGYCTKVLTDGGGSAVHNRRHSPMLGEHKADILSGLLGNRRGDCPAGARRHQRNEACQHRFVQWLPVTDPHEKSGSA